MKSFEGIVERIYEAFFPLRMMVVFVVYSCVKEMECEIILNFISIQLCLLCILYLSI